MGVLYVNAEISTYVSSRSPSYMSFYKMISYFYDDKMAPIVATNMQTKLNSHKLASSNY